MGLLALYLLGITAAAVRLLRTGTPVLTVAAQVTVDVINLGVAVLASVLGGLAVLAVVRHLRLPADPRSLLITQIAAGLMVSHVAASGYGRWCRGPLRAWFTCPERGHSDG